MDLLKKVSLFLLVLITSCVKQEEGKSRLFEKAKDLGRVPTRLTEASGLVSSLINPGYLWTLNDSGNPSEIFLIDNKGDIRLTCTLEKIDNRDWEDIAIWRNPGDSANYLYVGEIGDNEARYKFKYIYRFKEPVFQKDENLSIEEFDTLIIKLPDEVRDMESMSIDQATGDLYLVSKREKNVNVYLSEYASLSKSDTLVPAIVATIPYFNTVAIDISFDSKQILLKTYDEIYYWNKVDTLSIAQTLLSTPIKLDYKKEPQGESIAWNLDGSGFYTLSESTPHNKAKLYFYKKSK